MKDNWIKQMLSGVSGNVSSKRFFGFILIILWCIIIISNLFWGKVLKATLEEYMFYLIISSFATVLVEKFAPKKPTELPKT